MRIRKSEIEDIHLKAAILKAQSLKEAARVAAEAYAVAEADVIEQIRARQQKSTTVMAGGRLIKATVAQREVVNIDEPALRKALGAKLFDSFCVKKLDKAALKRGITDSLVDPVIVAQHSAVTLSKSYVLFSEPTEKEPDE